uniref:Laminin A chain n=1 Tax=Scleropages formosus TaxID=113540 RepID=A0A8C9VHE8_SCLFO
CEILTLLLYVQPGLFPSILNLASNAEISTNATCGEPEAETYCKLVEHVPGSRRKHPQCRTCDSESADPRERHPITNAIDGTNAWWQSPSIKNGHQFHWVTITLDLKQVFQVAYVIVKAANSPRPGNWILERSVDGLHFQAWQYYAVSDAECLTRYNITPRTGLPTYRMDSEVICTSFYSRLLPLEHGEIHTSLINGRPSADDPAPELQEFTSARYIRLRLQRIRTLNADLMALSYQDPRVVDPIVTQRYYYSIKDISVGGMCICYGHAKSCPWDPVTKKLRCICEHNTCGENCRECCPGYHQEPWQPGTRSDGNTCEKCNCHNKTEECYYNVTVAAAKMSVNTHGHFVGGGVCLNCGQNTAGVNCESCADGFFRPSEVSPYEEEPCVQCACDSRGSLSQTCVRDDGDADPGKGLLPGHCLCRVGFEGPLCDRCAPGFHGFPTCAPCNCNLDGSLGRDPCGDCVCKANVMGPDCDRCKPGFYNLQGSNPEGCTECFCFGLSNVCDSAPWSWAKVTRSMQMLLSSNTKPSETSFVSSHFCRVAGLNLKLTSYGGFLNYSVSWGFLAERDDGGESFPSLFYIVIEGNGRSLRQAIPDELAGAPQQEQLVAMEIVPWNLVDDVSSRTVQQDELMSVLANVSGLWIRAYAKASAGAPLRLSSVALETADAAVNNRTAARSVELCECPWGYAGTSCEQCLPGFYRIDGVLFGGNCLQCECHGHASRCDADGRCAGCEHNTGGPHCDQCLPGFYGNALAGTPEDCKRCGCPLTAEENNFSPTCHLDGEEVVCDQCQQGYGGPRCERCADGYYGEPGVPGRGCAPCDCNGNVDPAETGNCDPHSGECLKCVGHTAGGHCERCRNGFFGDAIAAKNCTPCGCHELGSASSDCDENTGRCACRPDVAGEKCDACDVGHYGLPSGKGCVPCNCSRAGALSRECSEEGACECARGVAGDKCDRCARGHYGTVTANCTECDCEHTHGNCHPTTGECACPPHTRGEKCEACEDGHWGHDLETGCKPCDCSTVGSLDSRCHPTGGQCQCGPRFSGLRCERCALGFSVFPECTACICSIQGTREEFCDEGRTLCGCDQSGVCVCKENVGGPQCERCERGTFGLAADHSDGCGPCFCSGVSSECQELEGLLRVPVSKSTKHAKSLWGTVLIDDVWVGDDTVPSIIPNRDSPPSGDLYWAAPPAVQRNKLLSYGGKLRYTSSAAAPRGLGAGIAEPPLILIQGGQLSKELLYLDAAAPEDGREVMAEVLMTEHKWKHFASRQEVNRAEFMSVLSNVELVLIKASGGRTISNVSLETAVEEADAAAGGERARFIEKCLCPPGYEGLSCQNCAAGHRREVAPPQPTGAERSRVHTCVPCQCNNHSTSCDVDTGSCQDCQHNTTGAHCHVCAPGYYGKVEGSIHDCSLCACPPGNTQSFSATCVLGGAAGFYCDACELGYEGPHCDRCSAGHYGDPLRVDGRCRPCQCSEEGSSSPNCHALTGQCECRAGVGGRRCTECQEGHALQDGRSCDDGCVTLLLDTSAHLELSVQQPVNLSASVLVPHGYLRSALDDIAKFRVRHAYVIFQINTLGIYHTCIGSRISQVKEQVATATGSLQATLTLLEDLGHRLNRSSSALDRAAGDVAAAKEQLRASEETGKKVSLSSGDVEANAERLLGRLGPLRALGEHLSHNLSHIQLLIQQTRLQAASVKVAVSAQRDCVRSYRPPASSGNSNSVTVTVRSDEPTNLLFYLGSNSSKDFMALEMHDGKVSFLWDVGSGHARLEYPDTRIDNNKWHRIEARRFGRRGSLMVQELHSDPRPPAKALSPGSSSVLEVQDSTLVFVGGISDHIVKSEAVQATRFSGCVAQASLNGKAIGLWNYAERWGTCRGCPFRCSVDEASFQFDGTAFSVVETAVSPSATHIIMQFRTASPGGLLLYLTSNTTKDFLSIELMEGRVRLTFELGSGVFTLTTSKAYNTGSWYTLVVQRKKRKGLTVTSAADPSDPEHLEGESPGGASDLNRANRDPIYIGGLPQAARVAHSCAQRPPHWTAVRFRFALQPVHSVTVLSGGFLQLPPLLLDQQAEVMATFSTHWGDGLILLGFEEAGGRQRRQVLPVSERTRVPLCCRACARPSCPGVQSCSSVFSLLLFVRTFAPSGLLFYLGAPIQGDYATLQLHGGQLFFTCDLGRNAATATVRRPIDDGQWHSVKADFGKKLVTLTVDDLSSGPVLAKGKTSTLDVEGKVYLGGLPPDYKARNVGNVTHSIAGCLRDAVLNDEPLDMDRPVSSLATAGCFAAVQQGSFLDGTGFGAFAKEGYKVGLDITVALEFRTTAPVGIILSVSGDKSDAIGLELVNGQVVFHVDNGAGRFSAYDPGAPGNVCDGHWHTVSAVKNRRGLSLAVDGKMVRRANPHPRASSADTKSPIYVGGLPSGLKTSCLTVETPFRGCMRNLRLTRGPQIRNLDFSKAFQLHGVIPHSCPAPVE